MAIGLLLVFTGLLVEAVAMISTVAYPLRRILPGKSPFVLQAIGGVLFVAGVVLIGMGGFLAA